MAILAVNAGSSSLKFSVYPVLDGLVQPSVLSGNIQGLEPQGTPEIGWKYQGRSFCEPVTVKETDLFQSALLALRNLLQGLNDLPMLRSVADCIVSDTQRSADIIRKLRNLFRMSKGEHTTIHLDRLVMDVLDLVQPKMQSNDVLLSTEFDADFRLIGDATQLQQVVLNVLNNAIEAVAEKRTRYPHLKIRGQVQGGDLVLEVEDNGKGIPVELQDEVFSLFKTSKSQGMGVGLWLSRAIVESHGGTLSFVSQAGQGTVFTLRLPSADLVLPT